MDYSEMSSSEVLTEYECLCAKPVNSNTMEENLYYLHCEKLYELRQEILKRMEVKQ